MTDPLERLGAANPVRNDDLPDAESPGARALFEEITSVQTLSPTRPGRTGLSYRPRRLLVPLIAVAMLSVGAAGAFALVTQRATTTVGVACYAAADLRSDTAIVAADGRAPIEVCASAWASGAFGTRPAQTLEACVLPSGVAGVFPAASDQDVCDMLGLAVLTTEASTLEDGRVLAFKVAIVQRFDSERCLDREESSAIVREELDRAGLASWAIIVGPGVNGEGFSSVRPCAGLAIKQAEQRVILVPGPPRSP